VFETEHYCRCSRYSDNVEALIEAEKVVGFTELIYDKSAFSSEVI